MARTHEEIKKNTLVMIRGYKTPCILLEMEKGDFRFYTTNMVALADRGGIMCYRKYSPFRKEEPSMFDIVAFKHCETDFEMLSIFTTGKLSGIDWDWKEGKDEEELEVINEKIEELRSELSVLLKRKKELE